MTRPHLTFLVQPDQPDRARIRYSSLLPHLHQANWGGELLSWPSSHRDRRQILKNRCPENLLVLPAHLYSESTLALLRRSSKGLILDLDDAVFTRPWDKENPRPSKTRESRFRKSLEAQDAVVTAGPYLRKYLLDRHKDLFLRLIPNPIAVEPSPVATETLGSEFRLLWIGSRSTLGYLESILPSLNVFAKKHPETVLKVVSDAFPKVSSDLKIEKIQWSLETQRNALQNSSIGLMPLDEHPWSLGKSGFKVLQYMNAGMIVVSSRHGNGEFLLGRDYPFFADSENALLETLECVKGSPDLGMRWGAHLKGEAARRFNPRVIAKSWMSLAAEIYARLGA